MNQAAVLVANSQTQVRRAVPAEIAEDPKLYACHFAPSLEVPSCDEREAEAMQTALAKSHSWLEMFALIV